MSVGLNSLRPQSAAYNGAASCDVLYVSECSPWGKIAYEKVVESFRSVQAVFWSPGMPKPDLSGWHGDWIISFKSDLILPRNLLERAKKGAINFHPSPPKYRGLGGYWWAIHNRDNDFGATCHHMDEQIDHGEIISTEKFAVSPGETVESLKQKTAFYTLCLLDKTLNAILDDKPLTPCGAKWERHLYTAQELALAKNAHTPGNDQAAALPRLDPFAAREALQALEIVHNFLEKDQARLLRPDPAAKTGLSAR